MADDTDSILAQYGDGPTTRDILARMPRAPTLDDIKARYGLARAPIAVADPTMEQWQPPRRQAEARSMEAKRPKNEFEDNQARNVGPGATLAGAYAAGQTGAEVAHALMGRDWGSAAELGVPLALGTFAGVKAKNANLEKLELAKHMEKLGVPRDQVWQQTGWGRFPVSRQWYWEFGDRDADYRPGKVVSDLAAGNQPPDWLSGVEQRARRVLLQNEGFEVPTGAVLDHPELYANYPSLEMTPWKSLPPDRLALKGAQGSWHGADRGMEIDNRVAPSLTRGKSVTLHEVAGHGVADIEDFPKGGNPEAFKMAPDILQSANSHLAGIENAKLILQMARETGHSPNDIRMQLVAQGLLSPTASHTTQMWIPHGLDYLETMSQRLRNRMMAASNPGRAYWTLEGEVYPRNIQKRMDMTTEERSRIPPWQTQDVPDLQQRSLEDYMIREPDQMKPAPVSTEDILKQAYGARKRNAKGD